MGTQPNDPMYNYGQAYPPQGPPSNQGRGMALTGLILGIVGLVLCWVPLLNVMALVIALVGLALSIAALVIAVRRRTSAKGLSIAGTIVSALAVLGSILAIALLSALFSTVNDSVNNNVSPYGSGQTTSSATAGSSPGSATAAPATGLLPLGTAADVGDYSVTVSSVQPNATDEVLSFNPANQPPSGQYVLITLNVVYNGTEEGDPWLDLSANFVGSDNRQYDESSCTAVLGSGGAAVPTLENGGQADYQVCMDVPSEALPGERVLIEETLAFNGPSEASWQTQ